MTDANDTPEFPHFSKDIPRSRPARSMTWKVLTIFGLIVLLLVPLGLIANVIDERQRTRHGVVEEIAQSWAGEQSLIGPILAVPYTRHTETTKSGKVQSHSYRELAYLLPRQYRLTNQLKPEVRYRGIYQSTVYTGQVKASGDFDLTALDALRIPKTDIHWNEAFVALGVSHPKGMTASPNLTWQGNPLELMPGVNGVTMFSNGMYAPVQVKGTSVPFALSMNLKGSESFSVVPVGQQSRIEMASSWPSPSFFGSLLPVTSEVSEEGFTAAWDVPYFVRNFGQAFVASSAEPGRLQNALVGVRLFSPVDAYRQSERAVKYGVLFLVLTFATFLLFEVINRKALHPFQYLLVGCAISLFYLLLIALSEVIPFGWAYLLAGVGIVAITTMYAKAILGKVRRFAEWMIAGLLTLLYSYLYVLLQLEDLSLLFGAIGLFLMLGVIMYVTRNINWYLEPEA